MQLKDALIISSVEHTLHWFPLRRLSICSTYSIYLHIRKCYVQYIGAEYTRTHILPPLPSLSLSWECFPAKCNFPHLMLPKKEILIKLHLLIHFRGPQKEGRNRKGYTKVQCSTSGRQTASLTRGSPPHLLYKRGIDPRVKPGVWRPEIGPRLLCFFAVLLN
jgi:hypothetical protein